MSPHGGGRGGGGGSGAIHPIIDGRRPTEAHQLRSVLRWHACACVRPGNDSAKARSTGRSARPYTCQLDPSDGRPAADASIHPPPPKSTVLTVLDPCQQSHVGLKTAFGGLFRSISARVFVFFRQFCVLEISYRLWVRSIQTKIDELTERVATNYRGNEGAMHTRLTGRDGGVAERYTKMWHCGSPRIHIKFRVPGEAGRHLSI